MKRESLIADLGRAIESGNAASRKKAEKALLAHDRKEAEEILAEAENAANAASVVAGKRLGEAFWDLHREASHLHQKAAARYAEAYRTRKWKGALRSEKIHMDKAREHLGYIPANRR